MHALQQAARLTLIRVFGPELSAWYGLVPLCKVFWGYGVLASSVLVGLYALALAEQQTALQQSLLILFVSYTVWFLVSVWRCAEASHPQWRLIARSLTVAWAGNAALVVMFLQLDLIATYFGL